jgi:hypothetical protein
MFWRWRARARVRPERPAPMMAMPDDGEDIVCFGGQMEGVDGCLCDGIFFGV